MTNTPSNSETPAAAVVTEVHVNAAVNAWRSYQSSREYHYIQDAMRAALEAALEATPPAPTSAVDVDGIITTLYRRFKDWSKRGFGPDDVTWCEVKDEVTSLVSAALKAQAPAMAVPGEMVEQAVALVDNHIAAAKRTKDAPIYKTGVPMGIYIQDLQELRADIEALATSHAGKR
jgi:hypothetical protein